MKMKKAMFGIYLFVFFAMNLFSQQNNSPKLSDPYFGQKPPGITPIRFSPDFISTKHRIHSSPTFSPDYDEVYWSVFPRTSEIKHKNETVLVSKKVNNIWSSPKVASFSGEYSDGGPFLSHDGKRLYFYSRRPISRNSKIETKGEIWFVEKQGENWSEPQHVELNLEGEKLFFSVSKNNNIYFTSGHGFGGTSVGTVDIYCAKFINGTYAKPERLPNDINSIQFVESDPLISPDEKYLIFYSLERSENIDQYDLYISYHIGQNEWTKPQNLGVKINTGVSRFPGFSPDGKYLFYIRGIDGVYWINAKIIEDYKPKELKLE